MGVSSSKLDDDKALLLCRERKRFVRQALDGMCLFAAAHVAYVQSLRNTGIALRKFVEPDAPVESSLYTSTSATPEPLALTEKSLSQFSHSSPSLSQHVEPVEPLSPADSSPYSGRFQVNYMKTHGSSSATVEERPAVLAKATLMSSSGTPQNHTPRSAETQHSFEALPPPPRSPQWDYFNLFHPIDKQFSFQDGRTLSHDLEIADDIQRLREEEGIPDLEEEGERDGSIGRDEYEVTDDENGDKPSDNQSLQNSIKDDDELDSFLPNVSPKLQSIRSINNKTDHLNGENKISRDKKDEASESETSDVTPSLVTLPIDGNGGMGREPGSQNTLTPKDFRMGREPASQNTLAPKDFFSSIKEIEYLFIKASESGNKVPRMVEANEVRYHPIFPETKARRSSAAIFITSCLACFEDPELFTPEHTTTSVKYLTWHRSASSRSSSSRNPLSATKDDTEDSSHNVFNNFYMNSGSHASTLDRLYAWERKLYDEVKASGIIRREYDLKCKLLRHQDSKGENPRTIDKTRASVKDLHSRIRVAIHRINSISKRIEELRDKELQPQLEELTEGLCGMWKAMLESHKLQFDIISIAYNNGSAKISMQSESRMQATIHLENELNFLHSSFMKWIGAHETYLQAINGWLLKCVFPLHRKYSRGRQKEEEFSPRRHVAPPVFVICRDWLHGVKDLEMKGKAVADSIKELVGVTTRYLPQQDKTLKRNLSLKFSSVPRKANDDSSTAHNGIDEAPVDWNSGFRSLKSSLVEFFCQLNAFADSSLKMYLNLRQTTEEAQREYDRPRK